MKDKKQNGLIILISIVSIFLISILYVTYKLCTSYQELAFEYEGSALGEYDFIEFDKTEEWAEEEYVYNRQTGYFSVGKEEWNYCLNLCQWYDFDFEPELKENEEYVCTYGYRLNTLEYAPWRRTKISKGYYNRATLWTDDYKEGVYYFYKIEKIGGVHLGGMNEKNRDKEYKYYHWEQMKYMYSDKYIVLVSVIGILSIILILILCQINSLYIPYERIFFEYKGSASGKLSIIINGSEEWSKERYVYNTCEGYFTVRKKAWDFCIKKCEWNDFDFQPELKENEEYVCTYGYRLKTLEYSPGKQTKMSKGYYNRATLWTDDYKEGVYYFYKIEKIGGVHLGGMSENDKCSEYDYYR